jgi:hypothetical protein
MSWGTIELELNVLSKGVESANRHNDSFSLMKNHDHKSSWWLIDMVQPCDTNHARSNSDFGVKFSTVQFYTIEHNFKSNHWIKLKLYQKIPKVFVYAGVHFQGNPYSERISNIGPTIRILLFTSFWLVDFLFGKDPFRTRMWELVLGIS